MDRSLVHFDRAKKELALASKIDEVKNIRDKAEALRAYMKQAGESLGMQNHCAEIKIRAERKAGEMLRVQEKHQGGRPTENQLHSATSLIPSYDDLGIEKTQASRWQAIANIPEEVFEDEIKTVVEKQEELTSAGMLRLAKKLNRENEIEDQKRGIRKLPPVPKGKYEVINIDPPWPYGTEYDSEARRIASPYPEMSIDELMEMELPSADNCVLWLWTTHRFIWNAKELMKKWGFEYKLILTWNKEKMGIGNWLRCQCEFSLLGIKGKPTWGLTNERDIIVEARREHSRKPDGFYEMVDNLLPNTKKIDVFGRMQRKGWDVYGSDREKF